MTYDNVAVKKKEFFELIFGDYVEYYRIEVHNALKCKGEYGGGPIHPDIVLFINSAEGYISKTSIYAALNAFTDDQDTANLEGIIIPTEPEEILKLAKKFIDEFAGGRVQ